MNENKYQIVQTRKIHLVEHCSAFAKLCEITCIKTMKMKTTGETITQRNSKRLEATPRTNENKYQIT
jgi:hypothetical protein